MSRCEYFRPPRYGYGCDDGGCLLCNRNYGPYGFSLAFSQCYSNDSYTYDCDGRGLHKEDRSYLLCPLRQFANKIDYNPDKLCDRLELHYYPHKRLTCTCDKYNREVPVDMITSTCMGWRRDCSNYHNPMNKITTKQSSGPCYISTACVVAKGLPDDCDELQTLRAFRDKMSKEDEAIAELVKEYYKNAPVIVEKINQENNAEGIYNFLYNNLVVACVTKVKENKIQDAVDIYTSIYQDLKKKYI